MKDEPAYDNLRTLLEVIHLCLLLTSLSCLAAHVYLPKAILHLHLPTACIPQRCRPCICTCLHLQVQCSSSGCTLHSYLLAPAQAALHLQPSCGCHAHVCTLQGLCSPRAVALQHLLGWVQTCLSHNQD